MPRFAFRLAASPLLTAGLAASCLAGLAACSGGSKKGEAPSVTLPPELHALVGTVVLPAAGSKTGLTYTWTQTSGPETVARRGETTARVALTVRKAGTYGFSVVASDGGATSAPAATSVKVHDLDGGEDFTVSLKPDGTLRTWGDSSLGQLGSGVFSGSFPAPGPVCTLGSAGLPCDPLEGIVAVAAGRAHVIALDVEGTVVTWGDDVNGQLGNGDVTRTASAFPVVVCDVGEPGFPCVNRLSGIVAIAAGYEFSAALRSNGTVVTWGDNGYGQLGDGNAPVDALVPVEVCAPGATPPCSSAAGNVLSGVVALTAGGGGHALALLQDGTVVGWGHDKNAQVGNGAWTFTVSVPTPVCDVGGVAPCTSHLGDVAAIDAWSGQSMALKLDGSLWSWGSNDQGELGAITTDTCAGAALCSLAPVRVCLSHTSPCSSYLGDVVGMAVGRRFAMAHDTRGRVWVWGEGGEGQLGSGTTTGEPAPHQVCAPNTTNPCSSFMSAITGVAAGSFHAFALSATGTLHGWGDNDHGQVGVQTDGVDVITPVLVTAY